MARASPERLAWGVVDGMMVRGEQELDYSQKRSGRRSVQGPDGPRGQRRLRSATDCTDRGSRATPHTAGTRAQGEGDCGRPSRGQQGIEDTVPHRGCP